MGTPYGRAELLNFALRFGLTMFEKNVKSLSFSGIASCNQLICITLYL